MIMLVGCSCGTGADNPYQESDNLEQVEYNPKLGVSVIVDNKRDVTCWKSFDSYDKQESGISCISNRDLVR